MKNRTGKSYHTDRSTTTHVLASTLRYADADDAGGGYGILTALQLPLVLPHKGLSYITKMSNTLNIQPTSTTKETRDEVIARAAAAASATGSSPLKSSLRKWAPLPSAQNTNGPYQRVVPEAASYDKKQLSKSASDLSTDREEASLGTSQDTAQDETTEGSKEKVEEKVEV